VPRLYITSNPLHRGELMKITLNNDKPLGRVQVYNLKGQKIKEYHTTKSEIAFTAEQFPANGIYFLRFPELFMAKSGIPTIQKIIILK